MFIQFNIGSICRFYAALFTALAEAFRDTNISVSIHSNSNSELEQLRRDLDKITRR